VEKRGEKKCGEQKVGERPIVTGMKGLEPVNETPQEERDNFNLEANDREKKMGIREGSQEQKQGDKS
jgi:hypothetical protein